ncbi:DNA helicase B isoform X3 [Labeo rohita]|uniref:DNA helicase B isoform X3 n=1 Tax=Labeo rohita TaxID=84645 RepID=UPI0021E20F03|nr:DNA helicase B isoform X3 [Labeo rohita]
MGPRSFPQTITGYIIPKDDDENNDVENEDEEEEIQTEFLDMKEVNCVSSGGKVFKSSMPASKEVSFKAGDEKYRIRGRFPLCDPWWEVTCTVRRGNNSCFSTVPSSYPSYSLRTNLSSEEWSLFLKECGANPMFVKDFMEWLPKDNQMELINVRNALQDFEDSEKKHEAMAKELKSNVLNSVAWTHVEAASMYPQIMKYLPTLLPGQFMDIISDGKMKNSQDTTEETSQQQSNSDVLENLEELIKTDVWKLGFNNIMFKEFRMVRCEAKLEAFKVCNLLSRMTEEQRHGLKLYAELKDYFRETGSTYIEQKMLLLKMMQQWNIADEGLSFLHTHGVVIKKKSKVALHNFFSYERGIAESLKALIEGERWMIHLDVEEVLQRRLREMARDDLTDSAIKLDEDHVRAAKMICENPVTVISGKGGCGKTTLVSLVFKETMEKQTRRSENDEKPPIEVLLTAPTGRAASLLTKKNGCTAYTLHQVLWSFMNRKKEENRNSREWIFSKVRALVVDEGSLVSVQMLNSILGMLTKHAKLQKFVILGDFRQLPSIEPGNTLCDLFEGLGKWAIEMQTNHRAESELIVKNAGLISEMGRKKHYSPLHFDLTISITRPSTVPSDKRFIFVEISERDDALQEAIKFLLEKAPGLDDQKSSQIVSFIRKDCQLINEVCCKHYSGHVMMTHDKKINFQVGDKVCCTKNGYISKTEDDTDKVCCTENGNSAETDDENMQKEPAHDAGTSQDIPSTRRKNEQKKVKKERMCNGEIFFIKADVTVKDMGARCKTRHYLTLDDGNGCVVTSNYSELQRECKLRHAWARTIHTFQGSEAETIVYVLGNSTAQNWQHVYTAVTRGQKRVYVVGRERDLEGAIKRWITPRNTRLCRFVTNVVSRQGAEDSLTQSACSQSQETPVNHGFGPSHSTPVASQTPSCSQNLSRPSCVRHLYKEENGESDQTSNISLQEDVAFSQTYSWSPMDSCSEPSKVQDENASEISNHVENAPLLAAISSSSNECSRGSKRLIPVDTCTTPTKQPKQTTSEESPLASTRLRLLSISSPRPKSSRQLFPDN